MAEKVPDWIERLLLPKLSEIAGELKVVNGRIESLSEVVHSESKRLDERIDSFRNETLSRFEAINVRLDSIENRLDLGERVALSNRR